MKIRAVLRCLLGIDVKTTTIEAAGNSPAANLVLYGDRIYSFSHVESGVSVYKEVMYTRLK